jgi:hypothetical protein
LRHTGGITRRLAQGGRTALRAPVHSFLLPAGACLLVPACALTALALPPTTVERLTSPFLGNASTAARLGDLPLALPPPRRELVTAGAPPLTADTAHGVGRAPGGRHGLSIPGLPSAPPIATPPAPTSSGGSGPSSWFQHGVHDEASPEPDLATPPTAGSDETPVQGPDPEVGIVAPAPATPGDTGPTAPESNVPPPQDPAGNGGATEPGDVVDPPAGDPGGDSGATSTTTTTDTDGDTSDGTTGTTGSDPADCGPPGQTGQNPGLGGTGAPGQTGTNPGQCDNGNGNANANGNGNGNANANGNGNNSPDDGTPPASDATPPANDATPPASDGTATDTSGAQNDTTGAPAETGGTGDDTTTVCGPPGQTGQNPGLGGVGAPGQTGTNPGQCGNGNSNGDNGNGNSNGAGNGNGKAKP